jgi:hypothetical protein
MTPNNEQADCQYSLHKFVDLPLRGLPDKVKTFCLIAEPNSEEVSNSNGSVGSADYAQG